MKSILSVGMDVHKNSFSLCAYDGYTGEIVSESTFASDVKLVIKFIETLKSRYENDVEIKCGYEAGCLGYSLYKLLKDEEHWYSHQDAVKNSDNPGPS